MFLTSWHMLFATILTQVLSRTTKLLPSLETAKVDAKVIQNQILPVAACFAISLISSNKAYVFLSVSFIQMLKASTPVFVLGLSVLLGLETSTFTELNLISIISLAVAITSIGELRFNWTGFTFQIVGVVTESARLVLTNMLLKKLKLDSLSTLYYVAPTCFVLNSFACVIFEGSHIPWSRIFEPSFFLVLLVNGIVAFSLNVALVLVILHSSALALSLAGIVKDIMLVTLSAAIFQSPVSLLQAIGYTIALLALNLHKEYKKTVSLMPEPVLLSDHLPTNSSKSDIELSSQNQECSPLLDKRQSC
jgi:drug/metabolite transporter (DMT)-like permease